MNETALKTTRRYFLGQCTGVSLGAMALHNLEAKVSSALPHFAPKAKRVIFLTQSGGPSQLELFDHKPGLMQWAGKELPESVRQGQRLTTMTANQKQLILPGITKFSQYGQSGATISEWLPHLGEVADDLCFIKSMTTDQINHAPAMTQFLTGHQLPGRPSMGSWVSYGLGSVNKNLPDYLVLISKMQRPSDQPLYDHYWGSGFLPSRYQGVKLRNSKDPVLYLSDPDGLPRHLRRGMLDGLAELNQMRFEQTNDPEITTRIQQYEMAFRMQASVPELTDLSNEPEHIYKLYGEEAKKPGTFANSVLMARRMAERGVRFTQIYLNNWDHHSNVGGRMPSQCKDIDQPCHALIEDLKQRGMFEDTLIIWGGEFGRTIYSQGGLSKENYGRDHHPRCFTMWMAGGGTKAGTIYGETDDFSYNIVKDPLHISDFHATVLQLLGYDHNRFTYKFQGLDQKLTGVEHRKVIKELIA